MIVSSTTCVAPVSSDDAQSDPFDLDIRVLELGDQASSVINLTDDGCGSTCSSPCATNIG